MTKPTKKKIRLLVIGLFIIGGVVLARRVGMNNILKIENISKLKTWMEGFGIWGPVIYILLYIVACLFFLPGLPVTILAAVIFGPLWGAVWSSLGSILGASAAFLTARYAARDLIEAKFGASKQFKKIDQGVKENGWRMLLITRIIPLFPFNAQNYIYGLTKIKLRTYVVVSWLTMIPATVAYCFGAGSIVQGGSLKQIMLYLSIAAVCFVFLSLLPKWLKQRNQELMGDIEEES